MPQPVRHVGDAERRARLGVRNGLADPLPDIAGATRAITVWHATEPASVHLAIRARTSGVGVADVEHALYTSRELVKLTAMRQTLFAAPPDLLPALWGSAAARAATTQARSLAKDLVADGIATDGAAWLAEAGERIVAALADGTETDSTRVRELVPMVDLSVRRGSGRWARPFPLGQLMLNLLGAQGRLVRSRSIGHWRVARPTWTATDAWLGVASGAGGAAGRPDERAGYAELVRRWLRTFGPGTEADLRWWLGGTLGAVRAALADLAAVPVTLDGAANPAGRQLGWLLPEDTAVVPAPERDWVALLPTLDPTVMGWTGRGFYLDALPGGGADLFDSVGNAGTTAWHNGRVVGCWSQDDDARVGVKLLTEVPDRVVAALAEEAGRLTAWLDGAQVTAIDVGAATSRARSGRVLRAGE